MSCSIIMRAVALTSLAKKKVIAIRRYCLSLQSRIAVPLPRRLWRSRAKRGLRPTLGFSAMELRYASDFCPVACLQLFKLHSRSQIG